VLCIHSGTEVRAARKGPEVGTQGQSRAAQGQAMKALYARLSASVRATEQHRVGLTADELSILVNPRMDATGRFRVGVHRTVGRSVANGNSDLVIHVAGAPAIRLELKNVKGTVAVFNDAGQAHEYSEDGFTHTFRGDEVRVRGSAHVVGAGAVNLGANLCDFNAACTENAECVSIHAAIDAARNAYASILFISGPFYYVCSGGLIADTDTGSEIPYFLTANHCVGRDREAKSLETFFQYVQPSCAAGSCSLPAESSTSGSTILATNKAGDYTLLQLWQPPPAGSAFLGWNDDPVAFTNGTDLYRISHPGGAPQAYSEHSVDASAPTCRTWPRGERIYSRDTFGATEGGSSGSPVLNASAEVVGQLSGACGYNLNDECDASNNATVDGAFAFYYPEVEPFLGGGTAACSADSECDDGNPCTTDSCDSAVGCINDAVLCPDDGDLCTTDACDPGTGQCDSTPVTCDDGVSCTIDSCDAVTGECVVDDSQCPVCLDPGASCSSDSECCGGKCRGKAGQKTCK
jgi:hypothetical protein